MKSTGRFIVFILALALLITNTNAAAMAADTLYLPAALTIIEEEAFAGDQSISKVVLPDKVTEIRSRAFANSSLSEINLPSSLAFIADDAFDGPEKVRVTSEEGTYAHSWAIDHKYYGIKLSLRNASERNFSQFAGSRRIEVTANDAWTITDYPSWVSFNKTSGNGSDTVTVYNEGNPYNISREAVITFTSGTVTATITIVQDAKESEALTITTNPISMTVPSGTSVTLTVAAAGGTGSYTYQWKRANTATGSGSNLSSATSASYTYSAGSTTAKYYYWCVVSDGNETVASDRAKLTLLTIPGKPTQNNPVVSGNTITVSWTAVDDAEKYIVMYGLQTSTSTMTSVDVGNVTSYTITGLEYNKTYYLYVKASNAVGNSSASSTYRKSAKTEKQSQTLTITTNPSAQSADVGAAVTMSVTASGGSETYSYQWYKASDSTSVGTAVSGATSQSNTFTASSTDNGCYYYCKVTSGSETAESSRAILTVIEGPSASAPVVKNSVTNETYAAKSIVEYNRNKGGFNLTYSSENGSGMYHVTAIIINEEPLFDNSEHASNQKNSDQTVKILYDDDMMETSIPFALNDLQLGSYLKIAVGAYSASNTTATADAWTVFGIKLINNQPVVVPTDTATNFAGQIWTQLKNWGLTDYQAAGIMGNISAESAYCPYNAQDSYGFPGVDNRKDYIFKTGDAVGFGLCQWTTSGRKTALQSSAAKGGWTVWDFDAQMNYMLWELNTNYYRGQTWMTYFKSQTTLRDATVAWMKVFENPNDQSTSAQNHRVSLAQTAYDTYAGAPDVKITSISLSSSAQTIGIGGTNQNYQQSVTYTPSNATNKSVTWSSGNTSIAAVDPSTGIVTGVAGGSATITATAADGSGKTASYTVYVVGTPTIKLGGTAIAAGTTTTWNTNSDLTISWSGASANRYLYKIITLNEKPAANQSQGIDANTIINQTTASTTTSYSLTAAQLASYAQSAKYLKIWVQALNSNDTAHGPSAWIGVEFINSSSCALEIGSTSWTDVSYEGANKTISVTSDGNYTISIDQPGRSTRPTDDGYVSNWLSATKTSTGVKLTAKKNYANVSRTATVTLKCATHGTEKAIIVKQNANSINSPEVTISLNPTTAAPGDTVTATVTYTNAQRLYLSTAYNGDSDIEKTLSLSTSEKTATYTLTVPSSVSNGKYKVTVNVSNSDIKNDSWALADSAYAYLTVESGEEVDVPTYVTFEACDFVASSNKPTSTTQAGPIYDQTTYPLNAGLTLNIPFSTDTNARKATIKLRYLSGTNWYTYTSGGSEVATSTTSFTTNGNKKTGTLSLELPSSMPIGAYILELFVKNSTSDSGGEWISARARIFVNSTNLRSFTVLRQDDYDDPTADMYYNEGRTIKSSGCGICAIVNAVDYLTGNAPDVHAVAKYAMDNGEYTVGEGTNISMYKDYADSKGKSFGFKYVGATSNYTTLQSYLRQGCVAIVGVTRNSGGGHIIVIAAYNTDTGKYLVLDSAGDYSSWTKSMTGSSLYAWQSISSGKFEKNSSCYIPSGNNFRIYGVYGQEYN